MSVTLVTGCAAAGKLPLLNFFFKLPLDKFNNTCYNDFILNLCSKKKGCLSMYIAYFIHIKEGWLYESHSPKNNPKGEDWNQITKKEYDLFWIVQNAEYPS